MVKKKKKKKKQGLANPFWKHDVESIHIYMFKMHIMVYFLNQ